MPRPLALALTCAALVSVQSPLRAQYYTGQPYTGECAKAKQVYDSMNLAQLFQRKNFKGYQFEGGVMLAISGRGDLCFEIGYYDIRLAEASADRALFTFVSKHMKSLRRNSKCDVNFNIEPVGKSNDESLSSGNLYIDKQYGQNEEGTCSVRLTFSIDVRAKGPALRYFGVPEEANVWFVDDKGAITEISFWRFRMDSSEYSAE